MLFKIYSQNHFFFPLHLLLSYVNKMRNHRHRILALEEAVMGLKPENIKIAGEMCLKCRSPQKSIHSFYHYLLTSC